MNPLIYAVLSAIAKRSVRGWCAIPEPLRDAWADEWLRRQLGDRYIPRSER